jgi:hypothetical protein
MPLSTPAPPVEGLMLVSQAVESLSPRRRLRDLLRTEPRPRAWRQALPLYTTTLDHLAAELPLGEAEQVGWRYLVNLSRDDANLQPSLVDLGGVQLGSLRFHTRRRGGRAERVFEAVLLARETAPCDRSFEMRILSWPALFLEALWLHSESQDRFIRTKSPYNEPVGDFDAISAARQLFGLRRRGSSLE